MVAYSFKRRFVPQIFAGTKTQTIRAERCGRSRHARAGEAMQLYEGMRTKHCRKIAEPVCLAAWPIRMDLRSDIVFANDRRIRMPRDLDAFAVRDGFSDWGDLVAFWTVEHPGIGTFEGALLLWQPLAPAELPDIAGAACVEEGVNTPPSLDPRPALRAFVVRNFRTQKAYARARNVSPAFVSMVLSGGKSAPRWMLADLGKADPPPAMMPPVRSLPNVPFHMSAARLRYLARFEDGIWEVAGRHGLVAQQMSPLVEAGWLTGRPRAWRGGTTPEYRITEAGRAALAEAVEAGRQPMPAIPRHPGGSPHTFAFGACNPEPFCEELR